MAQVTVEIAGRSYRLACDEGQQEHIMGLARRLNGYATDVKASRTPANEARIVVMAALMLADELGAAEAERDALKSDLTAQPGGGSASNEDARAQIEEMENAVAEMLNRAADQLDAVTREVEGLS